MKKPAKVEFIHTTEAAAILVCSDQTVRRLAVDGELHGYRLTERGYYRIERASVIALAKRRHRDNFSAKGRSRR